MCWKKFALLGNLENRRGKLLQIILAGQQELDRKLEAPEFRQLKQRIALRCTLRGFERSGDARVREFAHGARRAEGPDHRDSALAGRRFISARREFLG